MIGRFIDVNYPLIATARLSEMMLDYPKLLDNGISGLKKIISDKLAADPQNEFYITSLECLDICTASADYMREQAEKQLAELPENADKRRKELRRMADVLAKIRTDKPGYF